MRSTTREGATIEELTELFGQDLGRCELSTGIGIGRWGKVLWECKQPAEHVVLFTCPEHGSRQVCLCGGCRQLLRFGRFAVRCTTCHRRGKWKPT